MAEMFGNLPFEFMFFLSKRLGYKHIDITECTSRISHGSLKLMTYKEYIWYSKVPLAFDVLADFWSSCWQTRRYFFEYQWDFCGTSWETIHHEIPPNRPEEKSDQLKKQPIQKFDAFWIIREPRSHDLSWTLCTIKNVFLSFFWRGGWSLVWDTCIMCSIGAVLCHRKPHHFCIIDGKHVAEYTGTTVHLALDYS